MWKWILFLSLGLCIEASYVENYYCGDDNCYELLGVPREATKQEIRKAFRTQSQFHHPDKFQDHAEKEAAEIRFKRYSTAKDILLDSEIRADYDYMLDHPDEFYMNYYRAWRRRNYPNVDVRIVLAVTISIISAIQYYNGWSKYNEAISYFSSTTKYRNKAVELAKEQGIWVDFTQDKKKNRTLTKQQIKDNEDAIIRKVIEDKMDIRGVYAKPTIYDLLWIQLVMCPLWTGQYVWWYGTWVWNFNIKKRPYGEEDKLYIIRKHMKLTEGQFMQLEEEERKSFLKLELWKKDKFDTWKYDKDEETRIKLASNSRHKQYKRYLKRNGPGRMYFDD